MQERKSVSFLRVVGFATYLLVSIPFRRLFGRKPPVEGWSIRQEFSTKFLTFVASADVASLRRNEVYTIYLANLMLRTRLTKFVHDAGAFSGLWYGTPEDDNANATVLYCHGGGFVWCRADTYAHGVCGIQDTLKKRHGVDARIFALDYSLAPEAKYPTQINEAMAAYEYLAAQSSKPLVLMGDSAGGNLVLAVLQKLKTPEYAHLRKPVAAVAVSPWCELNLNDLAPSYTANKDSDFVHVEDLVLDLEYYLGSASLDDPLITPMLGDFSGSCPVLLHYGGKEAFADDIRKLASILKEQEVKVTLVEEPLAPHVTPMIPTFYGDMSWRGIDVIASFIAMHSTS